MNTAKEALMSRVNAWALENHLMLTGSQLEDLATRIMGTSSVPVVTSKFSELLTEALEARDKARNFARAGVATVAIKRANLEKQVAFARLDTFLEGLK